MFSIAQHSPPLLRGSRGKPPGRDCELTSCYLRFLRLRWLLCSY
jgi:hypothetical protein